ncbi:MAG: hypothetical protein HKP58_05195 [Desulfatitalea sp.]|nr:hypothetical protein [Desulfatitalea sp.]NNJ99789.1 hypothetical protein [Desulfatitalea sp.]
MNRVEMALAKVASRLLSIHTASVKHLDLGSGEPLSGCGTISQAGDSHHR